MARQNVGIGFIPNDGQGDNLRIGGDKINDNFIELYNWLTSIQALPLIIGYHTITKEESMCLTSKNQIIPSPGDGKLIDLISLIARITPADEPTGGLELYPEQTLNVTTDGDTETKDWGYFPTDFLMSEDCSLQKMTPVFSTQIFEKNSIYVSLGGGFNPKSGAAQIDLFYIYRIVNLSGVPAQGELGYEPPPQIKQYFLNILDPSTTSSIVFARLYENQDILRVDAFFQSDDTANFQIQSKSTAQDEGISLTESDIEVSSEQIEITEFPNSYLPADTWLYLNVIQKDPQVPQLNGMLTIIITCQINYEEPPS